MSSFSISLDNLGIKAQLAGFKEDIAEALRPAAQSGAKVLYQEVKKNISLMGYKTGNLSRSIYQAYSKDNSVEGKVQTYHISWNATKAPHGHLVEYGHVQTHVTVISKKTGKWITLKNRPLSSPKIVGARPFVRPAMSKFPLALEVAKTRFFEELKSFK